MTILLCILIESILYFWFLFLAIDMFEVNDMLKLFLQENSFYDVSLCVREYHWGFFFHRCQQNIICSTRFLRYQFVYKANRALCFREFRSKFSSDPNYSFFFFSQQATYIFNSHQRHNRSSSSAYSTTGLIRNLASLPYDRFRNDHLFLLNNLRRE